MFGPRGTTAAAGRSRMESLDKLGPRRGRPRKFMGPSRAVTLTLPDYVLDALSAIDPDLSRAVVRLTQPELAKQPHPPAELVRFGQSAVIVVNPTRTLEQRTGVNLIPLPDGRAIISFNRAVHDRPIRADSLTTRLKTGGCREPIRRSFARSRRFCALPGGRKTSRFKSATSSCSSLGGRPDRHVEALGCALSHACRSVAIGMPGRNEFNAYELMIWRM